MKKQQLIGLVNNLLLSEKAMSALMSTVQNNLRYPKKFEVVLEKSADDLFTYVWITGITNKQKEVARQTVKTIELFLLLGLTEDAYAQLQQTVEETQKTFVYPVSPKEEY